MMAWLESVGRYVHFAVRALLALPGALVRPGAAIAQLYHVLLGALPLGMVAGAALGVVIWMHLHSVLARFGAAQFLPQALALAVVLEFAPTGAGLIMAGRSGASLGAELGSMRLTEQVDALEALGVSPMRVLVGPRVLACMIAMPLLTMFIIYCALVGSFAAEMMGGRLSWLHYQNAWLSGLRLADVIPATLKTVVFGYLIGATGCYFGMQARGGTEGVGRAATAGVVTSTFLVLASNVLLVRLIQLLG
ncbi:MAG TPA: ABC transporter permease [Gemmataceae bacterium]|jgi:phospholipid/cholesterol/gamma-HCH transport system permease protein|nr:ABC transporter permease [Gemmataceae bacterium]